MFIWYRRITCKLHKTRSAGYVELVWSDHFRDLVLWYIEKNGYTKRDQPFQSLMTWKKKLEPVFVKFVDPALWGQTQGMWDGRTLRRMEIKKIVDEEMPTTADIKLRNIGEGPSIYQLTTYPPFHGSQGEQITFAYCIPPGGSYNKMI